MTAVTVGDATAEIDLFFFDCDGIIFDVNPAKSAAFDYAVADYPAPARQALVAYHQQSGGISRYHKLRRFFTEMCPVDDVDHAVERALERFGDFSRKAYEDLVPRPEALQLAAAVDASERGYVVSGSDQTELVGVFDRKGITHRFAEVLGSPTDKPTHLRRVMGELGTPANRALFIGDGRGDFDCADELGVWFVFLAEMSDWVDGREVVLAAQERFARARGRRRGSGAMGRVARFARVISDQFVSVQCRAARNERRRTDKLITDKLITENYPINRATNVWTRSDAESSTRSSGRGLRRSTTTFTSASSVGSS